MTRLAPVAAEMREGAILAPGSRRVAFVENVTGGQRVVVDGLPGPTYAKVSDPVFRPNGVGLAYAAQQGDTWRMVVDGKEQPPYPKLGSPVFSPDSKRLAYVAMQSDGSRAVLVDGKSSPGYEMILEGRIAFSPDSAHVAFGGRKAQGWFVVVDGTERGPYEFLGAATGYVFSRDGKRLACAALAALAPKQWSLVVDGKPLPPCENIGECAISPDGRHIAYAAQREGKWQVIADGKPGDSFDAIAENTLRYSADGKRLVYAAQRDKQWRVVVDGKPGPPYTSIGQIAISPDGKTVAYVARIPGVSRVVVDEKPDREYDRVGDGTLVFSGGGRRLAYVARSGRASFVVVDGKRKPRFDLVGCVNFAPDGRAPVYAALRDKKAFCVVEDKPSRESFDAIWLAPGERIPFDSPKKFHYLAVRDRVVYLVEEELE